jgi:hypothetical protein
MTRQFLLSRLAKFSGDHSSNVELELIRKLTRVWAVEACAWGSTSQREPTAYPILFLLEIFLFLQDNERGGAEILIISVRIYV